MKNFKFLNMIILALIVITFSACSEDEGKDNSILVPTKPTVELKVGKIDNTTIPYGTPDKSVVIEASLSEPQIVDVIVYVTQTGGNAKINTDYELKGGNSITIPAYRTKARGSITLVLKGGKKIRTEDKTLQLSVGGPKTGNASITPQVIDITFQKTPESVINAKGSKVNFELSWKSDNKALVPESLCTNKVDPSLLIIERGKGLNTANDILGTSLFRGGKCPKKSASLDISKIEEGKTYEMILYIESRFTSVKGAKLTVTTSWSRTNSKLKGSYDFKGFTNDSNRRVNTNKYTIEKTGDVVTVKDPNGKEVSKG